MIKGKWQSEGRIADPPFGSFGMGGGGPPPQENNNLRHTVGWCSFPMQCARNPSHHPVPSSYHRFWAGEELDGKGLFVSPQSLNMV